MAKAHISEFLPEGEFVPYIFHELNYECEVSQPVKSPKMYGYGAHYAVRLLGVADSIKDVGTAHVRGSFVGTDIEQDEARDAARRLTGMFGRLYEQRGDGSRRWAWAECIETPEISVTYGEIGWINILFNFVTLSDWFHEDLININMPMQGGEAPFINNTGTEWVYNAIFILAADSWTNVAFNNLTTGDEFHTTRDLSTADRRLKLDAGRDTVEYSTTSDPTNYVNDIGNVTPQPGQAHLMRLAPGVNQLDPLGTRTGSNLTVQFYPAFK